MTDFSWFDDELAKVKWETFYKIKRNVTKERLSEAGLDEKSLPKDYFKFLMKYGEVQLFRVLNSDSYRLSVEAPEFMAKGTTLPMLRIGRYWVEGDAYLMQEGCGIYTRYGKWPRPVGKNFASWFKNSFYKAKKEYKKSEWRLLERPPDPFTPEEQRIANAIPKYRFEKLGIEPNGDVTFRVFNGSSEMLTHIEVGVKSPKLWGALFLDVRDLKPGDSKTVTRDCYKAQVPPESVSLYSFPKPTPEDRFAFKELASLYRSRRTSNTRKRKR